MAVAGGTFLGLSAAAWAAVGTTVAVASAAAAAYAQYQQAQAQAQAAKFNEQQQRNQALLAQYSAQVARNQQEDRRRRLMATQQTLYGAEGVVTTEGSPLAVMMDTAIQSAYDQALTTYGGARRAEAATGEAQLQRFYGSQATKAGALQAGTTLLGGVASGVSAAQRGAYYAGGRRPTPGADLYGP